MFSTLIIFPLLPSVYFSFLYFLNLKNNKTQDIFTSLASHEPYLCMLSRSVMSNSLQPHGLQPTRLLCPWRFSGKNTGVDCHALPNPGIEPRSLALQADSLPSQHQGSPRILVGSLSLLQEIFLIQESNRVSRIIGRFFTS